MAAADLRAALFSIAAYTVFRYSSLSKQARFQDPA